ncbi:MAG: TolC family outer membrane protein [Novosphingobium sp.]
MKRQIALMTGAAALLTPGAAAFADTLQQALEAAYHHNPTLTAQRANVRAADENVPLARAAGMPTLEASANYQENVLKGSQPPGLLTSDPDRQLTAQINANVPLLTFGAVSGSVKAAEARAETSRLGLRGTEAELFTAVVGAYMDVIRDEAIVRLNLGNHEVITYTLKETSERFRAGERGATDVAQAEARVALAVSQLETAQARLISSRENYVRLVGSPPGVLSPPPPLPAMPASVDDATAIALEDNPSLLASRSNSVAARQDMRVADAELLPRVSAIGGVSHYDYLNSLDPGTGPRNRDQGTTAYVGLSLKMPLYQGGRTSALMRQSREKYGITLEQQTEAERNVVAQTRSAFATWQSAQRVIESARNGVSANQRALEGIRAETNAGIRPLLDRLNAEQELLNAQVTQVTAERDAYVAGFALLSAMGRAEARSLNFDSSVLYDPQVHYQRVHKKAGDWDSGPMPEPVGTGTATVPAQDAAIGPTADTAP